MSKFKVNDRVKVTKNNGIAYLNDLATIKKIENDGIHFINTDKLNAYNHPDFNGNGLYVHESFMELIGTRGRWSTAELDYLHTWYKRKSISDIADYLGRSYFAVQSKARSENIHNHARREYNDRDNRFIQHVYIDKWPVPEIGRQLHRSHKSIKGRLSLMNSRGLLPIPPQES
jgi:hypothetical protein